MVSQEIENQTKENLESKLKEIKDLYKLRDINLDDFKLPKLSFKLKGAVAGYATYHKHLITLNSEIVMIPKHTDDIIVNTLNHELAHLIVNFIYKKSLLRKYIIKPKPHGYEWKKIMKEMGEKPEVTHNYEVNIKRRKTQRIACECECMDHLLTKRQHSSENNKITNYSCKKCKSMITVKDKAIFILS